ncbi:MAG TPA: condensation domain-containing protein, partial [Thermoanaerobaculia bacterium]|nr:condensation domain-containing protein [Thermoanaerobaculia bacterium]
MDPSSNLSHDVELLCELSPMQQAMLFHSLLAPGSGVYVVQLALRLTGPLDVLALERAFQHVVARHGILRTAFHWEDLEKPLQVVYRAVDLGIARESWRGLDLAEQQARLARYLDADRERGFELTAAPLMRLALFALGSGVHQLVWTQHHLLVDGWSRGQLLAELFTAYRQFAAGSEPWEERPRGFDAYIAWLQEQDLEEAEAFWRRALAGFTSPTFVAGGDEKSGPTYRESRRQERVLSGETTAALREVARRNRLTLNTLVQGAWALLLARASGSGDVVFGTTVSGRPADLPGVESIVGPFINTQPMRVEVAPERRLVEWLAGLQERQVEMRLYEYAPLVEVQRWSELPSGVALFDHLLVFENLPLQSELAKRVPELQISEVTANELTNYPLNVVVVPGQELSLTILYDSGRFEASAVARILEHLAGLLATFAADPDRAVGELPVLLPAERQQARVEWNDTASAFPREASVSELFAAQVAMGPEAMAVVG